MRWWKAVFLHGALLALFVPAPDLARGLAGGSGSIAFAAVPATDKPPAPPADAPPSYDPELMRLAEILGGLHYLRPLCGATAEAQRWRTQMQGLIDSEKPSEPRKAKMVASFNRGYTNFAQVYHSCTPAAHLAVQRHLQEGARLAHDIVVRFSGN